MKIINFGTKSEDTNHVKVLRDGEKMMTFPRIRLTDNSIKNMSKSASRANINELLATANNLQYGLPHNSALRAYLQEKSLLSGSVLENNDWESKLQQAVKKAINKLPKNRREEFLSSYNEIFFAPKNLTQTEQNIINARESILASDPFLEVLEDKSMDEKVSKTMKFLDYFIASSETPMNEKAYILDALVYFMGAEYPINEQLKDKKFQIFSEIINDLVIKTPESPVLTTKECSQEKHGSCAATSMAAKNLLYEDRTAYVDMLLSELDDKPYMYIYDITNLHEYVDDKEKLKTLRAPKVKVDKAYINYDRATAEGYRIIDAAVLNWMKIALSAGDGTINFMDYFAFDNRHRGLMHDSRLVISKDKDYANAHALLRVLIKARGNINSYEKQQRRDVISANELGRNGMSIQAVVDEQKAKIKQILLPIIGNKPVEDVDSVIRNLPFTVNINLKNNEKIVKSQIVDYFVSKFGIEHKEKLQKNANKLVPLVKKYSEASKTLNSLTMTAKSKFELNKKLFDIAVTQREHLKRRLRLDNCNYVDEYFNELKMPDYVTQVKKRVRYLVRLVDKKPDSPIIAHLMELNGYSSAKELKTDLVKMQIDLEKNVPQQIDNELEAYGVSYKSLLIEAFKSALKKHRSGNYEYMYDVSNRTNEKPDVNKFDKALNRAITQLERTKPTNYTALNEIVRPFGVHNQYKIIGDNINQLAASVQAAYEAGEYQKIENKLGEIFDGADLKEIIEQFNKKNSDICELANIPYEIAYIIDFPTPEDIIMKVYEGKGLVLKEKELDDLKAKIDDIKALERYRGSLLLQKEDMSIPHKVYVDFTNEQKRALEKVKKSLPKFKREVRRDDISLNKKLQPMLEKLYQEIGKRKGDYWVLEEGNSGLYDNESIRIIEQMTGRPYHLEQDIDMVVKHIKGGHGSGSSSIMVSYDEFSGHAQYVADIVPIKVKNPQTGKIENKDAWLHDNTWGHSENNGAWIDESGVKRTDYDRKFGGKKGFVLTDGLLAGMFVDDLKYDYGVDSKCYDNTKAIAGPELEVTKMSIPYPIMNGSVRLPGIDPRVHKSMKKFLNLITQVANAKNTVDMLTETIQKEDIEINLKMLKDGDEVISSAVEALMQQIGSYDNIKLHAEDFDKLPANSTLKMVINKHIIRKEFPNLDEDSELNNIRTEKGLQSFKEKMLNSIKDGVRDIVMARPNPSFISEAVKEVYSELEEEFALIKTEHNVNLPKKLIKQLNKAMLQAAKQPYDGIGEEFVINITEAAVTVLDESQYLTKLNPEVREIITKRIIDKVSDVMTDCVIPDSIEEVLKEEDGKHLVSFIVHKYNPVNNAGILAKIVDLINMPNAELEKLLKTATFADFDIEFDTPQNVIKLIQAGNSLERKRFREEARLHYFDEYIKLKSNKGELTPKQAEVNAILRSLIVLWGYTGVDKYINQEKEEAFTVYRCRPGVLNTNLKSKEKLCDEATEQLAEITSAVRQMVSLRMSSDIVSAVKNIQMLLPAVDTKDVSAIKDEILNNLEYIITNLTYGDSMRVAHDIAEKLKKHLLKGRVSRDYVEKNLELITDDVKKFFDTPDLDVKFQLAEQKKAISDKIDVLVQSNVLPQYQSRIRQNINELIRIMNINKAELGEKIQKLENNLVEDIAKHHMYTEPNTLLKFFLQKIKEKPISDEDTPENSIRENLRGELIDCIKRASILEFRYKLMSMADKGYINKVKGALMQNELSLPLNNGETVDFYSPNGILAVYNTLKDYDTDVFNLCIEQTGLVDMFLDGVAMQPLGEVKKNAGKIIRNLGTGYRVLEILIANYKDNYSDEVSKIPDENIEILPFTDKYLAEVEKLYSTKPEQMWLEYYVKQFREIAKNIKLEKDVPANVLIPIIHSKCISLYREQTSELVKAFNMNDANLRTYVTELNSLNIKEGTPEYEKREKILADIKKVLIYINQCATYMNETF